MDTIEKAGAVLATAAALLAAVPVGAHAQTLVGTVVEEGGSRPVPGAVVRLLGFTGNVEVQTIADARGAFELTPVREGEFYLEGRSLGYEPGRSPLLRLGVEGRARVDLALRPAPLGLEGVDVRVDRLQGIRQELRFAGVTPEALGHRFLTRADFEHLLPRGDLGEVLQWAAKVPGIGVLRTEDLDVAWDDIGLCVHFTRPRSRSGGTCALAVLNGVPVPGTRFRAVDPDDVLAIAILDPKAGATRWGSSGRGGAILVWTAPRGLTPPS